MLIIYYYIINILSVYYQYIINISLMHITYIYIQYNMIIRKTISGLPYWHAPHVTHDLYRIFGRFAQPRALRVSQDSTATGSAKATTPAEPGDPAPRAPGMGWLKGKSTGKDCSKRIKTDFTRQTPCDFFELGTDEHHQKKGRSSHTTPIWFWRTCTCGFTSNALQICQPNHWWSSTTSLHTVIKVPLAIVVDIGLCRVLFNLFEWQSKFPV